MRQTLFSGLLCTVILFSIGCSVPIPPLNFAPQNVSLSKHKIQAELKSITISVAQENEKLGATQVGYMGNSYEQSFKSTFRDALEEAITKSAIFNDIATDKVSLLAKIMKFSTPSSGVEFNTSMIVRYTLIDRISGKEIYSKDVFSEGSVAYNYAFYGEVRWAEARNVAVRNNINNLLVELNEFAHKQSIKPIL